MVICHLKPNTLLEIITYYFMHITDEISHILALGNINPEAGFLGGVRDDETVVGICSREIKILLTYKNELMEKKADWNAVIETTKADKEKEKYLDYRGKSWLLGERIEMLSSMINLYIHNDRPDLLTKDVVKIREGWQIVWSNTEKGPDILPLLVSAVKSLSRPRPSSLAGKN